MIIPFIKAHGLGNDFIFIQDLKIPFSQIKELCDRHTGIGADGIVFWSKPKKDHVLWSIYNADGSKAQTCGNALRCLGLLLYEKNLWEGKKPLDVQDQETFQRKAQLLSFDQNQVTVEMGSLPTQINPLGWPDLNFLPLGQEWEVSLHNPHWVLQSEQFVESQPYSQWGEMIQKLSAQKKQDWFPQGANIGFLGKQNSLGDWPLVVFERGAGLTLCCGSGACAAYTALLHSGQITGSAQFQLPGGKLTVYHKDQNLFLKGEATKVFEGFIEIDEV